jgi:hypothetical protein
VTLEQSGEAPANQITGVVDKPRLLRLKIKINQQ